MEKKKSLVFFTAFTLLWAAIIAFNIFTPVASFSEDENRYLKLFPTFTTASFIDGTFMDQINIFLSDQFPGRKYWVSGQTLIEYSLGKREINNIFIGKNAFLGDATKPSEDITSRNIAGINAFAKRFALPTTVMLVPSSTSISVDSLPPLAQSWDEDGYIKVANAAFSPQVSAVDIFSTLYDNRDEYIYYRTDHHWTTYGGYLAYQKLAPQLGFAPKSLADFDISILSESFWGTYHSKVGFPLIKPDVIELYQAGEVSSFEVFDGIKTTSYPSIYFNEYLAKKDKYSYFLGQVQPYVTIHTSSTSSKKLIVFKDSYAHCIIPMLLEDYSEIKLVDLRFINSTDFNKLLSIESYDQALFLYSTDVFSQTPGAANFLLDKDILF